MDMFRSGAWYEFYHTFKVKRGGGQREPELESAKAAPKIKGKWGQSFCWIEPTFPAEAQVLLINR